ncbi:MAG: DNA methyltransferase [Fuerstiella sp.]
MPKRGIWGVFEKDYLEGRAPVKTTSAWTTKDVNSERGTEQFMAHGFPKEVFPRPKPVGTMERLLDIATIPGEDAIVIDLFGGSCTLAEACFNVCESTRRSIKLITMQLDEAFSPEKKEHVAAIRFCKAHRMRDTVAEIGKERIDAINPKKPLVFGDGNLAIVYGANGSGKSGYRYVGDCSVDRAAGRKRSPASESRIFE